MLAGCGSTSQPSAAPAPSTASSGTPASPAGPSGPPDSVPDSVTDCSQSFSATLVTALAGRKLGDPVPGPVGAAGVLTGCTWGSLTSDGVQAADVPSAAWGLTLPGIVAQLPAGTTTGQVPALRAAAARVSGGETLGADEACTLFSDVLALGGLAPGTSSTVTFLPSAAKPQAITAQGCADGRYRSLLVVRPDLTGTRAELDAVGKVFAAGASKPS